MIGPGEIQELLDKATFERFRIRMADGSQHDVHNAEVVAVMEQIVYLAKPKENWISLSYEGIISLEGLEND
jgi:hypothetical protein